MTRRSPRPRISWTPERDEAFARMWPTHGANWDGWKEALGLDFQPSVHQLYDHASALRVSHKRGKRPYSDEEERELERLIDWYCERHDRTIGSVSRKVAAMCQRRRYMAARASGEQRNS